MSSAPMMPSRRFNTIGLRLTLWGTAVTLAICAGMALALYLAVFFSLRREVDGFLEGEVHEFLAILRDSDDDYAEIQEEIRRELGSRARSDLFFRLIDADGTTRITSIAENGPQVAWHPPAGWGNDPAVVRFETLEPPDIRFPLRVCSFPLRMPDGRWGTAQAGYLLDHLTNSLAQFRRIGAIALAVAAIVAVLGGRFLASRMLSPVSVMTDTARNIGGGLLTDRLPRSGTGDELDRLAETLNGMLQRISQYVTRLQQFTADASHELRTPLAALRGSAEVALSRARSIEELRAVIEESIEHYDRLSRIAEDLLFLARVDAGATVLKCEPVRLDKAIGDVIDLYTPLAHEGQIEVQYSISAPLQIHADPGRIRQLFGNLLDNAIKYSDSAGRVELSLTQSNGSAVVTVKDGGTGIPADAIDRVFDRFYRVDAARAAGRKRGAGLGLPICRSIAEAHGGRIELSSTPGQGTTVTVSFPLDSVPINAGDCSLDSIRS